MACCGYSDSPECGCYSGSSYTRVNRLNFKQKEKKMTNIYMTGANGKIGRYLAEKGVKPLVCNVTNLDEVDDIVSKEKPNIIVHLAGKTDVDWCEKRENEDQAIYTNFMGTDFVASVAQKYGAKFVLLSSDHVFSGKRWLPWHTYNEKSSPLPVNFYGLTKLAAEGLRTLYPNFKIVRTSYLFDFERLATEIEKSQPSFIYRSFMYMPHFISNFMIYLDKIAEMPDILHITGNEIVSWYKFMGEYTGNTDFPHHDKEILNGHAPRPHRAGLTTKYPKLLPQYSYRDGFAEIKR